MIVVFHEFRTPDHPEYGLPAVHIEYGIDDFTRAVFGRTDSGTWLRLGPGLRWPTFPPANPCQRQTNRKERPWNEPSP